MYLVVWSSLYSMPIDSTADEKIQKPQLIVNQGMKDDSFNDYYARDFRSNSFHPNTNVQLNSPDEIRGRIKRAPVHVFRPLFVYRQQQIKRKRIIEQNKLRNRKKNNIPTSIKQHTSKPCPCCDQCKNQ